MYIRRLPSGLWQATVRRPDGRRQTNTDPLKSKVKAWAEGVEVSIRRGQWIDPNSGQETMSEWWQRWQATRDVERATAQKEISHWRCHIEPRWGGTRLANVTAYDVESWLVAMKKGGVGQTTRLQSFRLLRRMLKDAARHGLITADPTTGVPLPRAPKHVDRVLSREEWERLSLTLSQGSSPQFLLLARAGLRWSEMAGLHGKRVNPLRRQLQVVEVLQRDGKVKPYPKSSAGLRVVPLTDDTLTALAPLLRSRGLLWPGLNYSNWRRRVFLPALERAHIEPPLPTPHDLRHSYGSWLADEGVPMHEIAAIMGHASLKSTERYVHAGEQRMDRARRAIEGMSDDPPADRHTGSRRTQR